MEHDHLTEFSGVIGRVVRETFSWKTLFSGVALGFILVVTTVVLAIAKAPNVGIFVGQIIMAAALARFAVNGLFGEWDGTLFSSAGGSWAQVGAVTGRYLFLTFAWLVPLYFLGLNTMSDPQMMMMGPAMGGRVAFALASYMMLSALSPPIILIAAVSATDFGDFLSVAHWRRLFAGRSSDLFMVYAAYAGALGMACLIAFPILMGAFAMAWQLALLLGAVAGAFLFGWMASLLGRLCGFFAFGDRGFAGGRSETPGLSSQPDARHDHHAPAPASPAAVPLSSMATPLDGEPTGGPPMLPDSADRVQNARKKFETDPDAAIASLEQVHEEYAPHPQILHALVLMCHQAERKEEAVTWAKAALPVCFNRGALPLAAEILKTMWKFREALDLSDDQKLKIATSFSNSGELAYAANVYALVIQADRNHARAIKGVMHVAETLAGEDGRAADAVKLYSYLAKSCPETPLMEYIQDGLAKARKTAAVAKAS
ncbi:MAG: hypothetical protein IFK94_07645 [Acidobacteria bacterium]|uniref:Tetratricopeptide repeat protein n=1 Tax=Candidatus Polarisedimenticola svalbardensis TaxID=2886004 RepID=A0A8J7C2K8_9BACT|nr:hypothetical protein [Candidatus Polarisedimenticola svalbardensis]